MNPIHWRSTSSVCISSPEFYAVMGTAVVITAAATFWCTRHFSRRVIPNSHSLKPQPQPQPQPKLQVTTSPQLAVSTDELSYVCNNCATEKYSPEQLETVNSASKSSSPYKMVILVRTDLNMGKGKAAAQCCHAVLAAFKTASARQPDILKRWEREGQPKVTLKIENEPEMIELMNKARLAGLTAESIRDAGRTQVSAGTRTVCAIGPAPAKLIDTITGHLKLY